jgi:hypothetical protein
MSKIESVRSRKKFNFPTVCGVAKISKILFSSLKSNRSPFRPYNATSFLPIKKQWMEQNQNKLFSVGKNFFLIFAYRHRPIILFWDNITLQICVTNISNRNQNLLYTSSRTQKWKKELASNIFQAPKKANKINNHQKNLSRNIHVVSSSILQTKNIACVVQIHIIFIETTMK